MLIGKTGYGYGIKILAPGPKRVRMPSAANLTRKLTSDARMVMHWLLAHRHHDHCTVLTGSWIGIARDCDIKPGRIGTIMRELERADCIQRRMPWRFPIELNPIVWDKIERYGAEWEMCYWEELERWNAHAAERRLNALLARMATLPDVRSDATEPSTAAR